MEVYPGLALPMPPGLLMLLVKQLHQNQTSDDDG
jgi:hypothetical protein